MEIVDFDKNTYHYSVTFKFDCISRTDTRGLVGQLVRDGGAFKSVSRDPSTRQTVLLTGDGSQQSPFLELRISQDQLALGVGWYYPYEDWLRERNRLVNYLGDFLETIEISASYVSTLVSQYNFWIPADRVRTDMEGVRVIEDILKPYRLFVPEELTRRAHAYVALGDENAVRRVEFWFDGRERTGLKVLRDVTVNDTDLPVMMTSHLSESDLLVEKFNAEFLPLIVADGGGARE